MFKKFVISLTLLLAPLVAADPAQNLSVLLQNIESYQAAFTQKQLAEDGSVLQQTEGETAIARPQRLRWVLKDPYPSVIVVNQETLWRFDPELEQASRETLNASLQQTPALLLSGNSAEILDQYKVEQIDTRFKLTPLAGDGVFRELQLLFNDTMLVGMDIRDDFEQLTEIRFIDPVMNEALDDSLFEFTPPEGTDVLINE